jgi:ubiquinone/menaquinone biosynthesis C-methylase UbiE
MSAGDTGPAGNTYDKYGTKNPVARWLTDRFIAEVEERVTRARPISILDVGCGEGVLSERFARLMPDVPITGLDVPDPGLEEEWRRRAKANLSFVAGSAYELPYPDDSFDLVMALEVFEHLEHPAKALSEMQRVARRGLLLSVPWEPVWRVTNVLAGRYIRDLGNTPGHIQHWSRHAFVDLASTAGAVRDVASPYPWTIVSIVVP